MAGRGFEAPDLDFATLDLLPYGTIVVDQVGTVVYYNAREEEIAGRRREQMVGSNFFREVAPCTQLGEFYPRFTDTMREEGLVASFQFHFPFPERPRDVEIVLTSFRAQGQLLCLISVRDVTEERVVRERILRAERLKEIGQTAGSVAHNFNNLLQVITSNAELALDDLPRGPTRDLVADIAKASADGVAMVARILDSVRQEAPGGIRGTPIDLNAMVEDAVRFVASYVEQAGDRGASVTVRLDLAPRRPMVSGHASELREVLVNLLRNAVDAIEARGEILVGTSERGTEAVIRVADSGAGMSADVQSQLFRPLFTTKGRLGTGLGLSSGYAIVRRHGGDVTVESAPGRGTTFTVSLPLVPGPPPNR